MRRYTTYTVADDVETVPNRRQIQTRAMAAAAASQVSQISRMSSGGRRRTTDDQPAMPEESDISRGWMISRLALLHGRG
eukprot:7696014-Pyramimonas_sp.AAC.1